MRDPVLPAGIPEPLDTELLAWAAGFFDGEGTTIARTDSRRPDYFQLDVSVPQSGRYGVPEVLLKFQRATLGVGKIYRERDGLYKWRAGGRVGAELALALMWPWLGPVKRAQATTALEIVESQYASGRYRRRVPKYRPTFVAHGLQAVLSEPRTDLAWAAGFLDAEGCFGTTRLPARRDGSEGLRIRVSASQHGNPGIPAAVLVRLLDTVGVGGIERHGDIDDYKWHAEGARNVRAVLELLRPWLGVVKVDQALAALEAHTVRRVRGDEDRCRRGHLYSYVYVRPNGVIHRKCNACGRLRARAARASQSITQRRFRRPETRLEDAPLRYAA